MTELDLSSRRQRIALERIEAQRETIASLRPGSEEHRLSVKMLVLLQDALRVIVQMETLLAQAQQSDRAAARIEDVRPGDRG